MILLGYLSENDKKYPAEIKLFSCVLKILKDPYYEFSFKKLPSKALIWRFTEEEQEKKYKVNEEKEYIL